MASYYSILGLERGASREEVVAAYRKLSRSKKAHPRVLKKAYDVLQYPELRRRYDSALIVGRVEVDPETGEMRFLNGSAQFTVKARGKQRRPRAASGTRVSPLATVKGRRITAGLLVAVLALSFWVFVWPLVGWRFTTYRPGTILENRHNGVVFGKVIDYDESHCFRADLCPPAYSIEQPDGTLKWMPYYDVNRVARPR